MKKTKTIEYNQQIINLLVERYGMSEYYTKQCASGRRDGIVPEKIYKEYAALSKAAEKAVRDKLKSL